MKDDRVFLLHIRDSIRRIQEYVAGGRDDFMARPLIQDAVVRNFEIIGDAVKHLSPALKDGSPHVPWKLIVGMRDVLIHHYFSVNFDRVWEVVDQHLLPLAAEVDRLLQPPVRE